MTHITPNARPLADISSHDPHAAVEALVADFAATAAARDRAGGTAKRERDLIRQSGLLRLSIPTSLGGTGADWPEIMGLIRRLANADSATAHLLAFHYLMLAAIQLFGSPAQAEKFLGGTAKNNWFWGNAVNPRDPRTTLTPMDGGYRLDGTKSFCSGASDSDMLVIAGQEAESGRFIMAPIPTAREGIIIHDDWDNIGQRQTDSGSVTFKEVFVAKDECLLSPGPLSSPFATLRTCLAQLILANIYLGLAEGALAQAKTYLRALPAEVFSRKREDPYLLRNFGELHVEIAAVRALTDETQRLFQQGFAAGVNGLTAEGRGEIAIAIWGAKVATARTALNVTSRIFELMGARSTAAANCFDRFWRNARTHTLHDPLDDKLGEIGDWALNGAYPKPSFYS